MTGREYDRNRERLRELMSSSKKPEKPKRLFSKRNQARRAPPSLHYEEKPPERRCYEFDESDPDVIFLGSQTLPLKVPNVAPQAPPGTDPEDVNEYGMLKMSVVLEEFAAPFLDAGLSIQELTSFYLMVSLAWNLALEPGVDFRARALELLGPNAEFNSPEDLRQLSDFIAAMVQRKHDLFEDDRRAVGDLKVFPLQKPGDYYLQVVSVLDPVERGRRRSWISRLAILWRLLFGRR